MKPDRSKNDLIVGGLVVVLAIIAAGWLILLGFDRDVPESLSTLAVGIVGGVLGYVTAGRSKAQAELQEVPAVEVGDHPQTAHEDQGVDPDPDNYSETWDEEQEPTDVK